MSRRLWIINALLLLTLAGAAWGRYSEVAVAAPRDFLPADQLRFRDWTFEDQPIAPDERAMLDPDAFLVRRYRSPDGKEAAELAVVAGHQKRTVHSPGFCMAGGGWEVMAETEETVDIGGRRIPVKRSLQSKKGQHVLATYFFTDGDLATTSVVRLQAKQLFTRLRGGLPMGALVRVLVPVSRNGAAAQARSDELLRATAPALLARLREVRSR